jgi:hypothetical protein
VRRDDPSVAIAGTLERVTGCALLNAASLDPHGQLKLEYGGETKFYWEEQRPVREAGMLVFIDDNGLEVFESEVVIRLEDGSIVDPAQARAAPEDVPARAD